MAVKFYISRSGHITHHDSGYDYRDRIGLRDLERRVRYWDRRYGNVKTLTYGALYGAGEGQAMDELRDKATDLRQAAAKVLKTARAMVTKRLKEVGLSA